MKVVDEKGKIFGKLNIIDLLVVLLLIAAVVLVGFKVLNKQENAGGNLTTLTYTVKVQSVDRAVYDSILTYLPEGGSGDQLMADGKLLDAFVTDVKAAPHKVSATMSSGKLEIPMDEDTLDLTFTVKADVANAVTNAVGTQEVRVGKKHIVKTVHFELIDGVILTCDWQEQAKG